MINKIINSIIGDPHQRYIKKLRPLLDDIEKTGLELEALSDTELSEQTEFLKGELSNGKSLDDILVRAFAVCREACDRRLGMLNVLKDQFNFDLSRFSPSVKEEAEKAKSLLDSQEIPEWQIHLSAEFYKEIRVLYPESVRPFRMRSFEVQLIGGIALHRGNIAEMATGEGKTLASACPVYLNALGGEGVHVVTVNDYLARRDAETMGRAYRFLGLEVGLIVADLDAETRRRSYGSDITYGTNNEFGFDYLRDNMAIEPAQMVQRELNYCIIDEVDSVLIDEARTPLIISGPAEESTDRYVKANSLVRLLKKEEHFTVDEKANSVLLTDEGVVFAEKFLGIDNLYGDMNSRWVHNIQQALRAHVLYILDKEYVVEEGEVVIVDENTGRKMNGRRYSDGLHQAIEAKEGLKVRRENQTLATITFQNYFKMYNKLSGMTGTADTEAREFQEIYSLSVVVIPTNRPCVRDDRDDLVFATLERKLDAISEEVKTRHQKGQPILIGTISIEKSELISQQLKKVGVPHDVLNAKQHAREADIVLNAGQRGKVTIATNMAGRGTDIVLGEGVAELGGLHVLGTERHESRRIDNQLRGRAGRQGDPGSSTYYLCGDDDLLRIFGGDRFKNMMMKMDDGEALSHGLLNSAIKRAQAKVEAQNFESRKHLLDYDGVMNSQRTIIYNIRKRILRGDDVSDEVRQNFDRALDFVLHKYAIHNYTEDWDLESLAKEVQQHFDMTLDIDALRKENLSSADFLDRVVDSLWERYQSRVKVLEKADVDNLERRVLLITIDQVWKEHLHAMDHLRDAIRYRSYGQRDPLQVYKSESKPLFESCLDNIAMRVSERLTHLKIRTESAEESPQDSEGPREEISEDRPKAKPQLESRAPMPHPAVQAAILAGKRPGRNDLCPCGSGKKFKKCHGIDD